MYTIPPYNDASSRYRSFTDYDDKDILAKYLHIYKLPVLIKAPYREDENPSVGITLKNGKVFFKDFAKGISGSVYDLLHHVWRCSIKDVWKRLSEEEYIPTNYSIVFSKPSTTTLNIKIRKWEKYDEEYWNSYGCSMTIVKKCRVVPISHYFINGTAIVADKLAYAYVINDNGKLYYKIYQPLKDKQHKWRNNYPPNTFNLLHLLEGDCNGTVAICSSVKDDMCLMSNIKGVTAICGQSECITNMPLIPFLKDLYTKVVIIFDNDATGIKNSTELAEKYGITNFIIPKFEGGKDISDAYKCKQFNIIKEKWKHLNI